MLHIRVSATDHHPEGGDECRSLADVSGVDGMHLYTVMALIGVPSGRGPPDPFPEDFGHLRKTSGSLHKTTGIDPRRAPDLWIFAGGGVVKPTPEGGGALGGHPGVLAERTLMQDPIRMGQGSLRFSWFSLFLVVFFGIPAGFSAFPVLF